MTEFNMQPTELRSTAKELEDVSERMKGVMSRLSDKLAGVGAPWGDDDSGRRFRHGDSDNGYDAQRDWVAGSVNSKTQLLDVYAKGLRTAVETLENTDSV